MNVPNYSVCARSMAVAAVHGREILCIGRFHLARPSGLKGMRVGVRAYSSPVDGAIPAAKRKYVPDHGTYPKGFLASGTHVGVKPSNTRFPDLALLVSEVPCGAAAVFTKNRFQAAPVTVSRTTLEQRHGAGIQAVVINSGCANAVTGKGGFADAQSMARTVDACLPPEADSSRPSEGSTASENGFRTLVMSTGVIGQRLPIDKILARIPDGFKALAPGHDAWLATARAICTTDTFPKLRSATFRLPSSPDREYRLAGITKGAGMIHPNMATLLGVMATDAAIAPEILHTFLQQAVDASFNAISVDGDTSTNDTVALLANGAAAMTSSSSDSDSKLSSTLHSTSANPSYTITSLDSPDAQAFQATLKSFAQSLAQLVVRDGEGATKFVHVRVEHAALASDAKAIAAAIATSPLVKTALYGRDANWGRILCAIGAAPGVTNPATIQPSRTSVSFMPQDGSDELRLLVNGEPEAVDETRASQILQDEDLQIRVDLGSGCAEASYWFCDFSHEYCTINADYRT